jgi:hypothetical protein
MARLEQAGFERGGMGILPVLLGASHYGIFAMRMIRPVLFSAIGLLSGCTHVIPNSTPYYKDGPDQVEGPQGDIPAGAKAWVIWRKDSYARVWTDGGIDGWVWDRAVVSIWEQEKQIREEKKRAEEREKLRKAQQAERERQRQQQPQPPPAESQPAEQP